MTEYGVELAGVSKSYGSGLPAAVQALDLRVAKGSFVSLLGPSGCGKTTTLRMIAGLETPDSGDIRILGRPVFSASGRIEMAPARRKVGFVFQSYALWPHMKVRENLAFPLRRAGMQREQVDEKVANVLRMLKGAHLVDRYPGELSGGQQQRIALGRAIINPDNEVILFDEPLSNLDAKLREDLRMEIRALQEDLGFTAIYVTHDQAEAMAMSDRIVIMRDGRIEREGEPEAVFHDPRSRYVAEFLGAHNILPATVRHVEDGSVLLETVLGVMRSPAYSDRPLAPGAVVEVALPTEMIELAPQPLTGQDFRGTVTAVAYYGTHSDVAMDVGGASVRCRVPSAQRLRRGQTLYGRTLAEGRLLG